MSTLDKGLKEKLAKFKLQQYAQKLQDEGYDALQSINYIPDDSKAVDGFIEDILEVTNNGDKIKWKTLINEIKDNHNNNNNVSNVTNNHINNYYYNNTQNGTLNDIKTIKNMKKSNDSMTMQFNQHSNDKSNPINLATPSAEPQLQATEISSLTVAQHSVCRTAMPHLEETIPNDNNHNINHSFVVNDSMDQDEFGFDINTLHKSDDILNAQNRIETTEEEVAIFNSLLDLGINTEIEELHKGKHWTAKEDENLSKAIKNYENHKKQKCLNFKNKNHHDFNDDDWRIIQNQHNLLHNYKRTVKGLKDRQHVLFHKVNRRRSIRLVQATTALIDNKDDEDGDGDRNNDHSQRQRERKKQRKKTVRRSTPHTRINNGVFKCGYCGKIMKSKSLGGHVNHHHDILSNDADDESDDNDEQNRNKNKNKHIGKKRTVQQRDADHTNNDQISSMRKRQKLD